MVHGDSEAPGQRRDEDGDREGDVAEACRQALTKHHRSCYGKKQILRFNEGMKDSRSSDIVYRDRRRRP